MRDFTGLVLVVDDDAMVRRWAELSLDGSEFRLAGEASSIAEAVEVAGRCAPDLLLIDFRLSDGVGTDLVRALRLRNVRAPALLMTATRSEGLNEAALEAGAQGTVLKTGSPDELLAALRAVAQGERTFDSRHPSDRGVTPP